jgi:hypothetical protein
MQVFSPLMAGAAALAPIASGAWQRIAGGTSNFSKLLQTPAADPAGSEETDDPSPADAELQDWHRTAAQQLEAAGIDLSVPLELGLAADGSIEVRNAHIQALDVERLLNANVDLVTRFRSLAATLASSQASSSPVTDLVDHALQDVELIVSAHDIAVSFS